MMMVLLNCCSVCKSWSVLVLAISFDFERRGKKTKQNQARGYIPRVCALSLQLSTASQEKRRTFSVPKEIYGHLPKQRELRGRIFVFTRMTRRTLMMLMKIMMFVLLSYYCHTMPAGNGGMRSLLYFYSTQDDVNVRRIEGTIGTY